MRIVLDTNVFISALLVPEGNPGKILRLLESPAIELLVSQPILDELRKTLIAKFHFRSADAEEVVREIAREADIVKPTSLVEVIQRHPPDNRILECAIDGRADLIVTGDKAHLLPLRSFHGIPIVSPADFLRRFSLP